MPNVYSDRFLEELGLNGTATYTVPAGLVAIVRDIDAYAAGPLSSNAHLRFTGYLGETLWFFVVSAQQQASGQWRGRQVFRSGEGFGIVTDSAFDVRVSGYLLTAP